jgi:uncharacterized YigZ family protein
MSDNLRYIIKSAADREIKVKNSSFIGSLEIASSGGEAELFINQIKKKFHDATHNCYAYRIAEEEFRCNDDGEPTGTAGLPILQMLKKYHLVKSVLVVTRYFGGIKLGRGGLIRAYSQCAEETIQEASLKREITSQSILLIYPYKFVKNVQNLTEKYIGVIVNSEFSLDIKSKIEIPQENYGKFKRELMNSSSGEIKIEEFD